MDTYSHLKFYENSERGRGNATSSGLVFGGAQLVPGLSSTVDGNHGQLIFKTTAEKHTDIVEYLRSLPRDTRASYLDITRALQIDLDNDDAVLDLLKNNSKVDMELQQSDEFGRFTLQYRARYEIRTRGELKQTVQRVQSGVLVSDIKDCYHSIEEDCADMAVSGEVIEYKNSERKTGVLYPRGKPFFTRLSGMIDATPGQQMVQTTNDLRNEVRRGDAIRIGGSNTSSTNSSSSSNDVQSQSQLGRWYRVSAFSGVGDDRWNKFSSSVSSDADPPASTRAYTDDYTATQLPLDADYEGAVPYSGPAYKHGCTNDLRKIWNETALETRRTVSGEDALSTELLRQGLVSRAGMSAQALSGASGHSKRAREEVKKQRKRSTRAGRGTGAMLNAHLRGTDMERIVNEAYEASLLTD